jgi:hypothetical protein
LALRVLQCFRFVKLPTPPDTNETSPCCWICGRPPPLSLPALSLVDGRAAGRVVACLCIGAARQTERERCANRSGYDPPLIALGFHRFAPY